MGAHHQDFSQGFGAAFISEEPWSLSFKAFSKSTSDSNSWSQLTLICAMYSSKHFISMNL